MCVIFEIRRLAHEMNHGMTEADLIDNCNELAIRENVCAAYIKRQVEKYRGLQFDTEIIPLEPVAA